MIHLILLMVPYNPGQRGHLDRRALIGFSMVAATNHIDRVCVPQVHLLSGVLRGACDGAGAPINPWLMLR